MGNMAQSFAAVLALVFFSHISAAQSALTATIEVGNGPGQIGLQQIPNQACIGPAALTAAPDGSAALLDVLNQKILIIGEKGRVDIPIPTDLIEPSDILATRAGYLVVGVEGDVVHLDSSGTVLDRTRVDHSGEEGALRFTRSRDGQLAVESLMGALHVVNGLPLGLKDVLMPGLLAHGQFNIRITDPNNAIVESDAGGATQRSLTVASPLRITAARVTWAEPDKGALVAIQQSQLLPEEKTFVRITRFNAGGIATGEAYLGPEAYRCDIRKPFTRLTNEKLVALTFTDRNVVSLREVSLTTVGTATPEAVTTGTSATLISKETGDVLSMLEQLNKTPSVDQISMHNTTVSDILKRADAAMTLRWKMFPANYSRAEIQNVCDPPQSVWRRPHRLDSKLNMEVIASPYRWGGYVRSMNELSKGLTAGRLAGDVCTCRTGDCITPHAIGLDCSGFVSYAWSTGNYFTTRSLPHHMISKPVSWGALAPGDIVNVAGSHVRLVEAIGTGPHGRVVKVIESSSSKRCGGVCRSSYAEFDLKISGYRPYRRLNLKTP